MSDEHQHCSCNGIYLCRTCHDWVHAHPFEAKAAGWIVPRSNPEPGSVPATAHFAVLVLDCDGNYELEGT